MERLFNDRPITEMYVGYGRNDLPKMSKKELEKELDKANREIENIKSEIGDADTYPSFILKERLINVNDYKDKILKQIELCENNDKIEASFESMIENLHRNLKNGTITEDYHNKYVDKLMECSRAFEISRMLEEERLIKEAKELEEKEKKKLTFKKFKSSLSNYSKLILR